MNRKALLLDLIKENPDDQFARYALALEYKKENLLAEAKEVLINLKTQFSEYLPMYYQLGKLLESEGQIEAAVSTYKEGLTIATSQRDLKTRSELEEAIWMLED